MPISYKEQFDVDINENRKNNTTPVKSRGELAFMKHWGTELPSLLYFNTRCAEIVTSAPPPFRSGSQQKHAIELEKTNT